MIRKNITLRRCAIFIALMLLTLIAAEVGLRFIDPAADWAYIWPPYYRQEIEFDTGAIPGVNPPVVFETNRWGLRGGEPSAKGRRILVLGGSAAAAVVQDSNTLWSTQLSGHLSQATAQHVWVANGARPGMTTREIVLQSREMISQFGPWDLLLLMVGAEDMLMFLEKDEDYDSNFMLEEENRAQLFATAFRTHPLSDKRKGLANTAVWQNILRSRPARLAASVFDKADLITFPNIQLLRSYRQQSNNHIDNLPELDPALDEFGRNLQEIIDTARRNGTEPVILLTPFSWRKDMPEGMEKLLWRGSKGNFHNNKAEGYYTPGALAAGMDLYYATALVVCHAEETLLLEGNDMVAANPENFYSSIRLTPAGGSRVAEKLSPALAKLLPKK